MMKKLCLLIMLCGLQMVVAQAQSDFTTYQFAFRNDAIITSEADFTQVKGVLSTLENNGKQRQQWILKCIDGDVYIASAAMPDKLLRRHDDQTVSLEAYSAEAAAHFLWTISATTSTSGSAIASDSGDKLLVMLTNPVDAQSALSVQDDGSLVMKAVDFTLSEDPCRVYIRNATTPGSF